MVDLDAQPTVVGEQHAQRSGEAPQIGHVRVDVVSDDQLRRAVFLAHSARQRLVQKVRDRRNTALAGGGTDIH
jgi:hypothetical protein